MKDIFNEYGEMLKHAKSLKYLNGGANGWLS